MKIRRTDFMAVHEFSPGTFSSRFQRGYFPFDAADGHRDYTPMDCVLTLVADEFSNRYNMHLVQSCSIALQAREGIRSHWAEIVRTSRFLADSDEAIYVARVDRSIAAERRGKPGREVITGPLTEIGNELFKTDVMGLILVNVSQVIAVLDARATRVNLDFSEFWQTGE